MPDVRFPHGGDQDSNGQEGHSDKPLDVARQMYKRFISELRPGDDYIDKMSKLNQSLSEILPIQYQQQTNEYHRSDIQGPELLPEGQQPQDTWLESLGKRIDQRHERRIQRELSELKWLRMRQGDSWKDRFLYRLTRLYVRSTLGDVDDESKEKNASEQKDRVERFLDHLEQRGQIPRPARLLLEETIHEMRHYTRRLWDTVKKRPGRDDTD